MRRAEGLQRPVGDLAEARLRRSGEPDGLRHPARRALAKARATTALASPSANSPISALAQPLGEAVAQGLGASLFLLEEPQAGPQRLGGVLEAPARHEPLDQAVLRVGQDDVFA